MIEFDKKIVRLFIILVVLMVMSIYVYTNKILSPTINNNKIIAQYEENKKNLENEEIIEKVETAKTEEETILELKSMSETDRIYKYFSKYINCIDLGKYEEAYGYLNKKFKENYFPEQKEFENYINETYPEFFGVEYEDIDRQGTYYILTVRIYNALDESITQYLEQKFVVYENDFGNFSISFQVQE